VKEKLYFFQPTWFFLILVVFGVALGLGIRVYDLTDPPFDFHSTRQHRSAIIARGIFYESRDDIPEDERAAAMYAWNNETTIEPQLLEQLTVWLYRLGGAEQLWVPRLLSSIFWVLAGLVVLLLGRELGNLDGSLVAMFYILFLPYGIFGSRVFQPDPLMTCLIAWALWAALRWYRMRTLKMAILAGALGGLAIYIKSVAVFFIAGGYVGLILFGVGLWKALRDKQVWIMAVVTILPTALFNIYGLWIAGFLQQQLSYRVFPALLRDPAFYIRWQEMITNIAGYGTVLAALAGILLLKDKGKRGLLAGLWFGYGVYSLTFAYHTLTHDYYQLPLILIVAISLIVVLSEVFQRLAAVDSGLLARGFVVLLIIGGAFFKVWDVRVNLVRHDYREEYQYWQQIGELIEPGKKTVSLSHAYGYYLAYYGHVGNDSWPDSNDIQIRALAGEDVSNFKNDILRRIDEYDYFVVTKMGEFNDNPELKERLFDNYLLMAEGDGYFIFDLNQNASP